MALEVSFDKKKHIYSVSNKVILPAVTDIIKEVEDPYRFIPKDKQISKEKLNWLGLRGNAIHKAIEYDLHGILDESSVKGIIEPFFRSWLKAKAFLKIELICVEKRVFSLRLGYAGTMDLRCKVEVKGKKYFATVDFKSSFNYWDHFRFQPPLYTIAWYEPQYYLPKDQRLEGIHIWDIDGTNIAWPEWFENELFIIVCLKEDGSFPEIKIFPKENESPFKQLQDSLQLLRKYHKKHGGWDARKLFGEQYV